MSLFWKCICVLLCSCVCVLLLTLTLCLCFGNVFVCCCLIVLVSFVLTATLCLLPLGSVCVRVSRRSVSGSFTRFWNNHWSIPSQLSSSNHHFLTHQKLAINLPKMTEILDDLAAGDRLMVTLMEVVLPYLFITQSDKLPSRILFLQRSPPILHHRCNAGAIFFYSELLTKALQEYFIWKNPNLIFDEYQQWSILPNEFYAKKIPNENLHICT